MFIKITNWAKTNYALLIGIAFACVLSITTLQFDLISLTANAARLADGNFAGLYGKYIIDGKTYGAPFMPPLILLIDGALFWALKTLRLINFEIGYDHISMFHVFILKIRYLIVFVASYPLIKIAAEKFTKDKELVNRIVFLWITSPILIYLTFTQGNNDIYPAVATLAFLFFAFNKKPLAAMITLGLAAALKNYAVFLILPMAIILAEKDTKKIIGYLTAAFLAFVAPTLLYLDHFSHFGQGGGEGLLLLSTSIPSSVSFLVFPLAYFLIIFYLYFENNQILIKEHKNELIVTYGLIFTALFFTLSFYIPQWFLWTLPFLVFVVYKSRRLFNLYLSLMVAFFATLIIAWQNNLDASLFRRVLGIEQAVRVFPNRPTIVGTQMVATLFSAIFIALIYFGIKEFSKQTEDYPKRYILLNLLPMLFMLIVVIIFGLATRAGLHL
jgi:hypothetical protein